MWKYIGVFGIFTNVAVSAYYCYLESWTLSYVYHSIVGSFSNFNQTEVAGFFEFGFVDDFGIQYVDKHHAEHLFEALQLHYTVTITGQELNLLASTSLGITKNAPVALP